MKKPPVEYAFPSGCEDPVLFSEGMTLRDYFAAKALYWCLVEFAGASEDSPQPADVAYQIADAMLKARNA